MLEIKDLDKFSEMVEITETERKIVKKARQLNIEGYRDYMECLDYIIEKEFDKNKKLAFLKGEWK